MISYYALVAGKNDFPLSEKDFVGAKTSFHKYYNELLHAFGLGPFNFDEGIGALMGSLGLTRDEAKHVLNNLLTFKFLTYGG
jgi:hypothetical protein